MKNKFNHFYFDSIRYVIDQQKNLKLTSDELLVVISILSLQEQKILVSTQSIGEMLVMEEELVDDMVTLLAEKGYLQIVVKNSHVDFDLTGLFEDEPIIKSNIKSVFSLFEEEFRRPLTQPELQRLNDWLTLYSEAEVIESLRSASIMEKLDFNYINRILENEYGK